MSRVNFSARFWQEGIIIILLLLVLGIAVGSIEQARWISPQPPLTLVLVFSVVTGWLLVKSRLPVIVVHPLALLFGIILAVWQASNLLPAPEITSRVGQLAQALQSWWQTAIRAEPSEGTVHFGLFLIFITGLMGYVSTWFLLRRKNAWVAVALGAAVILVNLANLPEERYNLFLFYALAALLLVGTTNLAKHYYPPEKQGYPVKGVSQLMVSLLSLSVLAVSVAWLTPEVRVERWGNWLSTRTLWGKNIEKYFNNFLASVPAKQTFFKSDEKRALLFGDSSFGQGDELQVVVISDRPGYWRTRMYDSYSPSGWTSSNALEQINGWRFPALGPGEIAQRREMTFTVVPKVKTEVVLTGGDFVSADIPVALQTLAREPAIGSDIVAVTSLYPLKPDWRYRVTTSISSAAPEDLSGASDTYPEWITDYYLPLPSTLPERVRRLSETVTAEAATPYDKALAIKHYLARFNYYLSVKAPPQGEDGVDYFLFAQKSGNCVQFASAMAVMLRSSGIPARVSAGYAPGEWEATTGRTNLTAKERHAWAEVYFPGYGWVGFEATPGFDDEFELIESRLPGGWPTWLEWEEEGFEEWLDWLQWVRALEPQEREEWLESVGWRQEDLNELVTWLEQMEGQQTAVAEAGFDAGSLEAAPRNRSGLTLLSLAGAILLAYLLWSASYRRRQHLGKSDYASTIYRKTCFLASLARLGPQPQQTPLEYYARLSSAFPTQAEALGNIVQSYVQSRYSSKSELGSWQEFRLQQSWRQVRPRLIKRLFQVSNWFLKTAKD